MEYECQREIDGKCCKYSYVWILEQDFDVCEKCEYSSIDSLWISAQQVEMELNQILIKMEKK
jgi:hypothetical protein